MISYSLSSVKKVIKQPRLALIELNRLYHQGSELRSSPSHNSDGLNVLSEDWDNLIILDACRFDIFAEMASSLPGELKKVESLSSATSLFLRSNFAGEELMDTIYITSNPQLYKIENNVSNSCPIDVHFHKKIEVWKNQWHEKHRTVMPEVVTEASIQANEQYPNKRLIIHYLQPHAPYIGETGKKNLPTDYLDFWASYRKGDFEVPLEVVEQAYRENLQLVLPHVSKLLSILDGKTVVTADHGELLGERDSPIPIRRFGHPKHTNMPELLEVPWLVYDTADRPDISAESNGNDGSKQEIEEDVVKKRLQDLGYVTE